MERSLSGGDRHEYTVSLKAGDYLHVLVVQEGIDIVEALKSPAGETLVEVDSPTGRTGTEVLSIIASEAGTYTLEISSSPDEKAGEYRIEVAALRAATDQDRLRVKAEREVLSAYGYAARKSPPDLPLAVQHYKSALQMWRDLGDSFEEAQTLQQIGILLVRQGDPKEALPFFESSLISYRKESKAPEREAAVLNRLGEIFYLLGRPQEALDHHLQALKLFQRTGDRRQTAIVLTHLGGSYDALGRFAQARQSYEHALSISQKVSEANVEAAALNGLATIERRIGLPRDAIEHLTAAILIYHKIKNPAAEAAALTNLGALLVEIASQETAKEVLLQALPLQSNARNQAINLISLGWVGIELLQFQDAEERLNRAFALAQEIGDRQVTALSLEALGALEIRRGDAVAASRTLTQALDLFRALGDLSRVASVQSLLGQAQAAQGAVKAAEETLLESLSLSERLGKLNALPQTLAEIARLELDHDLDAALQHAEAAIEHYERFRSGIPGEKLRLSHFLSVHDAYNLYIDIQMLRSRARPGTGLESIALEAADRGRSRGLLEALDTVRIDLREGDPVLLAEEQRLRLELNGLANQRSRVTGDLSSLEQVQKQIDSLTAEHQIVEARVQAHSPRYAALKNPSIQLSEIQSMLGVDTVFLEYSLSEPRSYVWMVTPAGISSFVLPAREQIEELVRRVRERLRAPQSGTERREAFSELSHILLGPVLDAAAGRRLAIVADGALQYVPFSALPVPSGDGTGSVPLVVKNEVVLLPSAAVLREIRRSRTRRAEVKGDLAILADPVYEASDSRCRLASATPKQPLAPQITSVKADNPLQPAAPLERLLRSVRDVSPEGRLPRLSWSRREAEGIAAEAKERDILLALDFQANRDLAIDAKLGRYRIIHFATHGFLDTAHPDLSALALAQVDEEGRAREGYLRLHDVYHLRLNADLVVLSGCETALGKKVRGEGLVGLTHGFFHAGASQVVSSLWPVRDRATAELMQRFYRAMFHDGLRPSAALRRAQIEMWSQRPWRDPYYWAAFIAQGDWQAEAR